MRRNAHVTVLAALAALALPATAGAHGTARGRRDTGRLARSHGHGPCRGAALRPGRADMALVTRSTLCLIDRVRRAHHLRPLRMSGPLRHIASGQSADMTIGHYFGDASLSGQSPLQRILASGYRGGARGSLSIGQNIAWATGGQARPAAIVHTWMASPPHRQILLSAAYRMIGVGIHAGTPSAGAGGATYTILLAS